MRERWRSAPWIVIMAVVGFFWEAQPASALVFTITGVDTNTGSNTSLDATFDTLTRLATVHAEENDTGGHFELDYTGSFTSTKSSYLPTEEFVDFTGLFTGMDYKTGLSIHAIGSFDSFLNLHYGNSAAVISIPNAYFLEVRNTVFSDFAVTVPLPDTAPLFGAALVALGAVGYGIKRKQAAATV